MQVDHISDTLDDATLTACDCCGKKCPLGEMILFDGEYICEGCEHEYAGYARDYHSEQADFNSMRRFGGL